MKYTPTHFIAFVTCWGFADSAVADLMNANLMPLDMLKTLMVAVF